MKMFTTISILLISISCLQVQSQDFTIRIGGAGGQEHTIPANGDMGQTFIPPINSIEIKRTAEVPPNNYNLTIAGNPVGSFVSDGAYVTMSAPVASPEFVDANLQIINAVGTVILTFRLSSTADSGNGSTVNSGNSGGPDYPSENEISYIQTKLFKKLIVTPEGMKVPLDENYIFSGPNYVHIFIDNNGNPLISTIPQGIPGMQYVVHIIYLTNGSEPNEINYSVKQTAGTFIGGALVLNNEGAFSDIDFRAGGDTEITYVWTNKEVLLSTSTTDIEFEVHRNVVKSNNPYSVQTKLLQKHSIKMTKVYTGSFDVGLLNTNLRDPDFEIVPLPSDPNLNTVSKKNDGNRGIVTAMATLYFSPIATLINYLGDGTTKNPNYKLVGRSFLNDHKIYERIYPAVGISISDRAFENLFFGFNWEIARGGSLFVGAHYGKVNVFNLEDSFEFGVDNITAEQFELEIDLDWKTRFTIGANIDVRILRNLLGATAGQ